MPVPIVFDMDGVLLDSERLFFRCWSESVAQLGFPPKGDTFLATLGVSAADTPEIFYASYGRSFPYQACARDMVRRYRAAVKSQGVPIKAGAKALLSMLKEAGCPLALASSNQRDYIQEQLGAVGILPFFDHIVSAEDILHAKPDPMIYRAACEKLHVKPETAYAVEDAPVGVRSAAGAGMQVLMVPDMVQPDEEIRSLATGVFPSLLHVQTYLTARLGI